MPQTPRGLAQAQRLAQATKVGTKVVRRVEVEIVALAANAEISSANDDEHAYTLALLCVMLPDGQIDVQLPPTYAHLGEEPSAFLKASHSSCDRSEAQSAPVARMPAPSRASIKKLVSDPAMPAPASGTAIVLPAAVTSPTPCAMVTVYVVAISLPPMVIRTSSAAVVAAKRCVSVYLPGSADASGLPPVTAPKAVDADAIVTAVAAVTILPNKSLRSRTATMSTVDSPLFHPGNTDEVDR